MRSAASRRRRRLLERRSSWPTVPNTGTHTSMVMM